MEIYIHTKDDHRVKISEKFFNDSEYLQFMSELNQSSNDNKLIIKIPTIDYSALDLAIMAHDNDIILDTLDIQDLTKLINISNFLNINSIFLNVIEKIRDVIRNGNTNSLRTLLNEQNDFSEQEEKEIKDKDSWCKKWRCHDNSGLINKLYTT